MWNNLSEIVTKSFSEQEKSLNGQKESAFYQTKKDSLVFVQNNGLPSVKHEEWKYTALNQQLQDTFLFDPKPSNTKIDIEKYKVAGDNAYYLVFRQRFVGSN